jgi:hypothetical protein
MHNKAVFPLCELSHSCCSSNAKVMVVARFDVIDADVMKDVAKTTG